jgi:hypothetical protein|nr:MAG TPA: hypothetical protein [Caudoviricetes sp.]
MNFDDMKPVTAGSNDRIDFYWPGPSDQRKEGMTITGEYLEKFTFNEGKPTESTVYKIRTKDGRIAGVDDMATIKRGFENIEKGTYVGIRFNGKKRNPKTGREYNDAEVRFVPQEMLTEKAKEVIGGGEEIELGLDMEI